VSIAIFGATGSIGREIRKEALRRGRKVTAVVHNRPLPQEDNLVSLRGDIANPDDVAKIASGHDAVISAYSPGLRSYSADDAAELIKAAHESLFSGLEKAGVKRVIVVGGVGSLEASPGVDVVDSDFYPKEHRAHTLRNREILRGLRRGDYDLDWTYVSPPLDIKEGPRTGKFRVGGNKLLRDEGGTSRISEADFAIAILDELDRGNAIRDRITVAY